MPTAASHVWVPSVARSVTLDAFVPVPRGSQPSNAVTLSWPPKDPEELLDYQLDVTPALIGNNGDVISTLDVTISPANPGDLTVSSAVADGSRAVLWLAGGQSDVTYTVTLIIGTQAGRTIARSVLLPVTALAIPPIPASGLTTDTGGVLTDQNGNPILAGP